MLIAATLITVRGLVIPRAACWIPLATPIPCPASAAHTIGGSWGVQRGALKCRFSERAGPGLLASDCGRLVYVVAVRELALRFVAEITREEAPQLDALSDAGVLAYFRARWPEVSSVA